MNFIDLVRQLGFMFFWSAFRFLKIDYQGGYDKGLSYCLLSLPRSGCRFLKIDYQGTNDKGSYCLLSLSLSLLS